MLLALGLVLTGMAGTPSGPHATINKTTKSEPPVKIQPLIGNFADYTVKKGDTLYKIARSHDLNKHTLATLNHLGRHRLKPGQKILLPTMHIPPRNPGNGIVLNIPEHAVYIFRDGQFKAWHPCAVGQPTWQTVEGAYHLVDKEKNPVWRATPTMIERENIEIKEVAAGPGNPLGDRWMGWSKPGFGFHSTNRPASIGSSASHGCVRLYPETAHVMYEQVTVGMPILSIYEPMTLGKREGSVYLSVFPDIYDRGRVSGKRAKAMLEQCGLSALVDAAQLNDIVASQAGYPVRVIGSDTKLQLNGQPLPLPLPPTYANGRWMVPVEALAQALGGQTNKTVPGEITITAGRHTLTVRPSASEALFDGEKKSDYPCAILEGTTYAPLRSLLGLFNAQVSEPVKGALSLQTGK